MVDIMYKKGFIKMKHIWFPKTSEIEKYGDKADIIYVHGIADSDSKNAFVKKQYTLMTDLEEEQEALFSKIRKNFRYEIRRAERENVEVKEFHGKDMLMQRDIYDAFEKTYNDMYKAKNMKSTFNSKVVEAYMEKNVIFFSVAYWNKEPLVFHAYIFDKQEVRLLYSVSPFRSEKEMSVVIGRMNKYLHWKDMVLFKRMGIKKYDWGGIKSFEETNGIDEFKMGFGGEKAEYYNQIIGFSALGKVIVKMLALLERHFYH